MKRALYLLATLFCALGFAYTIHKIFFVAPMQGLGQYQGTPLFFNQKIFYYHVPNAFMLFLAVLICGFASLKYLRSRDGHYDDWALAAGELSVMFGAIVLVTGCIWGKVAWGKWWDWDARLTTSLLLWVAMLSYVLVRKYGGPGSERLAAGMGVFSAVNVPLVYYSVKIWRTLHPSSSVVPSLEGEQRTTLWLGVVLFFIFFILLFRARVGVARAERRVYEAREHALDGGLL